MASVASLEIVLHSVFALLEPFPVCHRHPVEFIFFKILMQSFSSNLTILFLFDIFTFFWYLLVGISLK